MEIHIATDSCEKILKSQYFFPILRLKLSDVNKLGTKIHKF